MTSDPAKHAIPKTVEVAYSVGVGELGWQYQLKSHGTVTTNAPEEGDMWTAWQLFSLDDNQNMPFQRRRKLHIPLAIYGKRLSVRTYRCSSNWRERRCPWCKGYRRRKWTRRHEFKSWTRLIAFHIALIPLGKVWT